MAQALISSSIRQGAQMRKKNTPATTTKKWRIHLGYYQVLPCLAHFSQPLHRWRMLMMAASFDNKTHTHTNKFLRDFFFSRKFFLLASIISFWYFLYLRSIDSGVGWCVFLIHVILRYFFIYFFFIYARLGNPNQKVHLKKNDNPKEYKKKKREKIRERRVLVWGPACVGCQPGRCVDGRREWLTCSDLTSRSFFFFPSPRRESKCQRDAVSGRYMYTCLERRRGWLAGCRVCVCEKTSFFFISFFFSFVRYPHFSRSAAVSLAQLPLLCVCVCAEMSDSNKLTPIVTATAVFVQNRACYLLRSLFLFV